MAYNAPMLTTHSPIPLRISLMQYAWVCFVLVVVMFSLAAVAYYWHESTHLRIYLALGLVLALLGVAPVVAQALHHKSE